VVAGTDHIVGEPITLTATQRYARVSGDVPDDADTAPGRWYLGTIGLTLLGAAA
jgi:hypothetical protein